MTGKERAEYRAKANSLDPLFQMGKGGISEAFISQVDGTLNTRELIKFKVLLDTSPVTPRQAADEIAEKLNADVIQVIGGVVVLYRFNPELHKNEKKKAAAKKVKKSRFANDKKPAVISKKQRKMAAQRKAAAAAKAGR